MPRIIAAVVVNQNHTSDDVPNTESTSKNLSDKRETTAHFIHPQSSTKRQSRMTITWTIVVCLNLIKKIE